MEAEASFGHFLDCFVLAPALLGDAINCAHCPSAVGPMLTVYENRRAAAVGDNLQEANNVFVFYAQWRHIDMLISQPGAFNLIAVRVEGSQVDDCFDAQLFQLLHTLSGRLRAAIQVVGDLM